MKKILVKFIGFYQRNISPLKKHPTCKYVPTCSCYAVQAINERGAFVGLALAVWRILRCNPFSKGGYDPVPPKRIKINKT